MTTVKTKHPGIRFKQSSKKYIVTKSIKGKREYREFSSLKDAIHWKNTYVFETGRKLNKLELQSDLTFGNVLNDYFDQGMDHMTESTRTRKRDRLKKFTSNILKFPMDQIDRTILLEHIKGMKLLVPENSRRCNFDKELKDLASVFSWYHQEVTHFPNPITKKHYKAGFIKDVPVRDLDLNLEEIIQFTNRLKEPFKSLALLQFLLGTRVSEVAALNVDVVDFKKETVLLKDSIVWEKGKPPIHHKRNKTATTTLKAMSPLIKEILQKLENERPQDTVLFFSKNGRPLRYNQIWNHYKKALIKAGLEEYSGTHLMRHSMATFTRKEADLNTAQKMLAHKSARQTEAYARLDADQRVLEVTMAAEAKLAVLSEVRATKCDQSEKLHETGVDNA